MKYVIMCGGSYNYWKVPRQLTEIKGEKLIERTIRLLKENGVEDIVITSLDPRFDNFGVPRIEHNNNFVNENGKRVKGYWLDAFLPSEEPITYIFGDVYFSEDAIRTIVNTFTNDILFFASRTVNRKDYFKKWQEPFAFKVVNQKKFRNCINICKKEYEKGNCNREPIAWELYRVINGYPINRHIMKKGFIAIDDYTTDIDYIGDIEQLEKII